MLFSRIWAVMLNNRAKKDSQRVLDNLEIHPGDIIADIGSGGGNFTFEMAKLTGSQGKVLAADTNEKLLAYVENTAKKKQLHNIERVICSEGGCPLSKESCDLIFMRNVFHHIKNPVSYFAKLRASIKPGGRIAVIDWKDTGRGFVGRAGHAAPEEEIHRVLQEAGFLHLKSLNILNAQSFNLYRKATDDTQRRE